MEPNAVSPPISYCAAASLILAVVAPATLFYSLAYPDTLEVAIIGVLVGCPLALSLGLVGRTRGGEAKRVANLAIGLAVMTVFLSYAIVASSEQRHPARQAQFSNNLKQVALALINYQTSYGRFPPAMVRDANGRPLYSWRVLILPFMGQSELYNQFHLDEAWDSPHNRTLLSSCPLEYRPIGFNAPVGGTFIQVYVGPGTAFENPLGEPLELGANSTGNFPDGTSETILAIEAGESVPWSAPFDLPYDPHGPILRPGGGFQRTRELFSSGNQNKNFLILFVNGSVEMERLPIWEKRHRQLISRNGGEPVPFRFDSD